MPDCAERERLKETLLIAMHEAAWLFEEKAGVAVHQPSEVYRFEEVVRLGKEHQRDAAGAYQRHIFEHDCASHTEIAQLLKDLVDRTRSGHQAAAARFDFIVKDCPSGLPHPDGTLRIQQAGKEVKTSLERYMCALKLFSEFAISGTVPKDLLPTG